MKRLFATLILLLTGLAVAVAAGSQEQGTRSGSSMEPVKLVFWGGVPPAAGPNQVIAAYTSLHPNVEIEYVLLGWDDASDVKLVTALMSGTGVDGYIATRNNLQKTEQGVALDLTEFLERDGIDLLKDIGSDATSYMYNGKFYTIPTVRFITAWMLNMSKFEEAGIPIPNNDWTIDEFMATAKALSSGQGAQRSYGAYITSNWNGYWGVLKGGYSDIRDSYNADFTKSRFDSPLHVDTLNRYLKMTEVDKSMPSYAECVAEGYSPGQMLLTEKAAMVACAQYILRDVKNLEAYPHDFKVGFVLPPLNPEYPNAYVNATLQDPIMISPKSKHLEESWQFVKWYFQEGMAYMIPGGRTPSYNKFDSDMVGDIFVEGYEDLIDRDSFISTYVNHNREISVFNQEIAVEKAGAELVREAENAIVGTKTVEQALADAKKAADRILSER